MPLAEICRHPSNQLIAMHMFSIKMSTLPQLYKLINKCHFILLIHDQFIIIISCSLNCVVYFLVLFIELISFICIIIFYKNSGSKLNLSHKSAVAI